MWVDAWVGVCGSMDGLDWNVNKCVGSCKWEGKLMFHK